MSSRIVIVTGVILVLALVAGSIILTYNDRPMGAPVPKVIPAAPHNNQGLATNVTPQSVATKVQYLGHSCFSIVSGNRLKIITDPYTPRTPEDTLMYEPVNVSADIVTVSNSHPDHNNVAAVLASPKVVRDAGVNYVMGIPVKGVATRHADDSSMILAVTNIAFIFTLEGVTYCHLGDIAKPLTEQQIADIGKVDVLFVPVGGLTTVDGNGATDICSDLNPRIVIPMHYKTDKVMFPLFGVGDFLVGKDRVKWQFASTLELRSDDLPREMTVIVLEPAR